MYQAHNILVPTPQYPVYKTYIILSMLPQTLQYRMKKICTHQKLLGLPNVLPIIGTEGPAPEKDLNTSNKCYYDAAYKHYDWL